MNFYASRDFLETAASAFFPHRDTAIADVAIGGEVLRLLLVDGRPQTRMLFLDMHQSLTAEEIETPVIKGRYARQVVRGLAPCDGIFPPGEAIPAPFVDWSGFADFATYHSLLLSRQKRRVRDLERRGRGLAAQYGELTFTFDDTAPDVLAGAKAWKSRQLQETGHHDFFADPHTLAFFEILRDRGRLVASTLRSGGRLASLWLGFIHEGSWSGWIFAYEPAFGKYSPGHLLLIRMLEESFRRGHREFDFSEGGEEYKLLYATHARLLGDLGRPPVLRAMKLAAKHGLKQLSPRLFSALKDLRRGPHLPKPQRA